MGAQNEKKHIDFVRVLIQTFNFEVINRVFKVMIDDIIFSIHIFKRPFLNWMYEYTREKSMGLEVDDDSCSGSNIFPDSLQIFEFDGVDPKIWTIF